MVALRICASVCASAEQFFKKSVFIKTVSVTPHHNRHTSSHLIKIVTPHHNRHTSSQSMFFIVLSRLRLSSLYLGQ